MKDTKVVYYKQYITDRATDLQEGRLGRKLDDTGQIPRPFAHYSGQLRQNEQMYMLLSGGVTPPIMVARSTSQSDYEMYYGQYFRGLFSRIELYAVPNSVVED